MMRWGEWLRHPLVLLLLSSAIIPAVLYLFNKQRDLNESRQREALDIVAKNSVFEGQLYALFSELGLFHQSNIKRAPAAEELTKLKTALDVSWSKNYLDFRKSYPDGHVWVDDLYGQGVILKIFTADEVRTLLSTPEKDKDKLPASDLKKLSRSIKRYKETINESLSELRKFWEQCISVDYEFAEIGNTSRLQTRMTNRLNELRDERARLITDMSEVFSR